MIISSLLRHIRKDILQDAFTFSYERLKRYQGIWHLERMPMFPGYIFLESDSPELLAKQLERYKNILEMFKENETLIPVCREEKLFLEKLCGPNHNLLVSKGFIKDGVTYVTEGPLKGKEQMICRIDRHKRIARLDSTFLKRKQELIVGLEIVSKS